jgi:hypothetical protein
VNTEGGRVRCVCSSSHAPGDGGVNVLVVMKRVSVRAKQAASV